MSYIKEIINNPKLKVFFMEKNYKPGDIIFEEGEESNSLYLIEKGDVIIQKAINKEKTEFKELAIISEYNILGEMAMFENIPRTARAKALTEVDVKVITKEKFFEIMKNEPEFSFNFFSFIIKTLSERISHTSKELTLLYDISKNLIVDYLEEKKFISALIDEISLYFENWDIEGYCYNIFNEEFEKVKELDSGFNRDINILNYREPLWIDASSYIMPVKIKDKVLMAMLFLSKRELNRNEINDFTTIFNTIYFIASSGLERTLRNKEDYFFKKLKQRKTGI